MALFTSCGFDDYRVSTCVMIYFSGLSNIVNVALDLDAALEQSFCIMRLAKALLARPVDRMLMLVLLCAISGHLFRGGSSVLPLTSSTLPPSSRGGSSLFPLTSSTLPSSSRESVSAKEGINCSVGDICPSGLFCFESQCECRRFPHDLVKCEKNKNCTAISLLVYNTYCVTFDEQEEVVLFGSCVYSIFTNSAFKHVPYYSIQPGQLNHFCAAMNKMGALCGTCQPGHYPLAYSLNMTCVPCPQVRWNWLKYIMAAYLPLTLFYFIIFFFKVNTMFGHIHVAICVCQAISFPAMIRLILSYLERSAYKTIPAKIILSLYGIWNLDFFRIFYTDFSLGMDVLPTLALDYVIAVYPLLLMVVSYLLIALYDRNYRVVTVLWSPFRRLFSLFRRNWDIRTTLVDAFATFFFLSNVKFLCVSFDLLVPTKLYHFNGINHTHTFVLYYSADIEYFGKEHFPYAILAITVVCVCVILPVIILTIYPFKLFRKFLNLFPFRWYILHTFMDSFQGCYKDGTELGTRDCRWFLSALLVLRIFMIVVYAATPHVIMFAINGLVLMAMSILVMVIKPFKTPPIHSNMACAAYLQFLAFSCGTSVAINLSAFLTSSPWYSSFIILLYVALFIPLVDAVCVFIMFVIRRRRGILWLVACCGRRNQSNGFEELLGGDSGEDEGVMSDRIENPEAYPKGNLSCFASLPSKRQEAMEEVGSS